MKLTTDSATGAMTSRPDSRSVRTRPSTLGAATLALCLLAAPWEASHAARTNYVDNAFSVEGIAAQLKDGGSGGGLSLHGDGFTTAFDGVHPVTHDTWLLAGAAYEHIGTNQNGIDAGLNRTHLNFGFISRLSEETQGFMRVVGLNEEQRACAAAGCGGGSTSATKLGEGLDFGLRQEWGSSWTTNLDLEADRLSNSGNGSSVTVYGGMFQTEYRPLLHIGIVSDFRYRRYQAAGGTGSDLTLMSVNVGLAVHF